jgi:hypothetical protein
MLKSSHEGSSKCQFEISFSKVGSNYCSSNSEIASGFFDKLEVKKPLKASRDYLVSSISKGIGLFFVSK